VRRIALLLALAALVSAAPAHAQDSLEAAKRKELQEISRQAAEQRAKAKQLRGRESKELAQIRRTEQRINVTRSRLRDLAKRQKNLGLQLEVTQVNLERSKMSLAGQQEKLRRRLREMYKFGPARELEFLLSTTSFGQLLSRWDFLVMIAEQDRQMLEDVRDRKAQVEVLEQRIQGNLKQVSRTTQQTTSENQRLAKQRAERQGVVRQIQTQREAYEAAAEELERTARAVQRLLADLERRRREEADRARAQGRQPAPYTGNFAQGQGSLDWPLRGELIGRFGPEKHPRFGTITPNNGIDIAAAIGTPVRSVAKGRVDYTSSDYGTYGQMIIINHGDGYYTLYGHLSGISVAVGQEVAAGQTIGLSGDTGSLKGPELHFEVRKGGTAVDPQSWLR
jgi:septal ring factor EnvC (AmiA/AmiB activator)